MDVEETSSVKVAHTASKKCSLFTWFRRLFTLDNLPNQKQHFPVFIITMSILHIVILLLTYVTRTGDVRRFILALYRFGRLYVPCMRPTVDHIRVHSVPCKTFIKGDMCSYDDLIKQECFSFAYPHQIWRMITVSFLHSNWLHLVSNLSAQLIQGIPIERKHGTPYTLVIYWLSGMGASLVGLIRLGSEGAVGASGCLHGLMLFFIMDRLSALKAKHGYDRVFIILQLVFLLLPYVVTSAALIIQHRVVHDAHVGGAFVGFLLGIHAFGLPLFCICKNDDIYQKIFRRLAIVLLILYFLMIVVVFLQIDAPIVDRILYSGIISNGTIDYQYFE
ncbi:unnamed protein product [Rotaria magnacalcarata]|nr:unnamed protein product [Rotaria magnacalcarata]CAF2110934.1 unnamed protein product [Rotaria magnacalcarata]CAF3797250.1 unnamed protein product [Rotaria magnacalcarata]CAF4002779.1 unnamed protein product [Rotaria magnacalcarata]CAF4138377.1 unnamed protein product [Rotaria magnacalcarata]